MPEEIEANPLDTWFENEAPEPEVVEEVEVEEVVEQEEVETTEQDEVEDDYDAPVKKKEEPKEDDEEVEKLPPSKAVERAKAEGKRRKELELTLKEKELDYDRVVKEREELTAKLSEFETTRIKPTEHPDFIALKDKIITDVNDEVKDLSIDTPTASILSRELGTFIQKYRAADLDENRDDKISELKDHLADKLFGDDSTFESLDKEDRRVVTAAVRLLKKSTAQADKLEELRNTLEERSKTGTLAVGVKEYERTLSEYKPLLDVIGDLSDDLIESNPYAIESVVASLAKLPEGKRRIENAKKDAIELITGLRPLTQDDIEKLSANGTDLKSYQAQRTKAFEDKKKKLLPMIVQALAARSSFVEMGEELAKLKKRKSSEDSEGDALRKIGKKKAVEVKEQKEINPVDIMFS